jgi:hypothetical protein
VTLWSERDKMAMLSYAWCNERSHMNIKRTLGILCQRHPSSKRVARIRQRVVSTTMDRPRDIRTAEARRLSSTRTRDTTKAAFPLCFEVGIRMEAP